MSTVLNHFIIPPDSIGNVLGKYAITNNVLCHTICTRTLVGRDSIPVRRPDSQSREHGFKCHCGRFEPLASLITPRCHSSLSCINEYLAIQTVVDMWTNSLRAAIAAWLNTSERSWDGLGMNRYARGWSVKRFEQSYGPDTALYKNVPLPFYLFTQLLVIYSYSSITNVLVLMKKMYSDPCLHLIHVIFHINHLGSIPVKQLFMLTWSVIA